MVPKSPLTFYLNCKHLILEVIHLKFGELLALKMSRHNMPPVALRVKIKNSSKNFALFLDKPTLSFLEFNICVKVDSILMGISKAVGLMSIESSL